jgi:hypothetical protein
MKPACPATEAVLTIEPRPRASISCSSLPHAEPYSFNVHLFKVFWATAQSISPVTIDARIVAGAIETAIELLDLPKDRFNILRLRNVSPDESRLATCLLDLLDRLIAGRFLNVGNNDDGSFFGETHRSSLADP